MKTDMKIAHALLSHDFPEVRTFRIGQTEMSNPLEHLQKVIDASCVKYPQQTHSDHIAEVSTENCDSEFPDTDALVTTIPGIAIGVVTADCVPVLIYDHENKIVAAVHAGWRGTVQRIVEKVLRHISAKGAKPHNIYVYIGVSISKENYEVGDEVVKQFVDAGFNLHTIGEKHPETGKFHIDLREANKQMLLSAGIPEDHIVVSETCTYSSPHFYSARRDGIETGRNFTGIMLRKG